MAQKSASGTPTSRIEVGSILVSTWGYEQTNHDFYKVTKLTECNGQRWVTITKLLATTLEYNSQQMAGTKVPSDTEDDSRTLRRRLIKAAHGEGFQIRPRFGWCSLWDGKPQRFTTYG